MEIARRLAGCSFAVNGVPFRGKLKAPLCDISETHLILPRTTGQSRTNRGVCVLQTWRQRPVRVALVIQPPELAHAERPTRPHLHAPLMADAALC